MDFYLNEKNHELINNYICPYSNSKKIQSIINNPNIIYDNNFVSLMNSISFQIRKFYQKIRIIIDDIKNINTSLESQTNHSKLLVKGISIKDSNYVERYRQLCDRIDMISESKKILDDNLSLINKNLSIFITDIKQIFTKIKNIRIQKINEAFNQNINNKIYDFEKDNNIYFNNKLFYEKQNYDSNNKDFNMINIGNNNINLDDDENDIVRQVLSSNHSPRKSLNKENNFYNDNIEFLVNKIKSNELEKKNNNNTLIFPNNINQNIINCTITSRDFNYLNNNRSIEYFNKIRKNKSFYNNRSENYLKSQKFSRNNILIKNKNIKSNKKIFYIVIIKIKN